MIRFASFVRPADLDGDGVVGPADLRLLLAAMSSPSTNRPAGGAGVSPAQRSARVAGQPPADLNRDGVVDAGDLLQLLTTFLASDPAGEGEADAGDDFEVANTLDASGITTNIVDNISCTGDILDPQFDCDCNQFPDDPACDVGGGGTDCLAVSCTGTDPGAGTDPGGGGSPPPPDPNPDPPPPPPPPDCSVTIDGPAFVGVGAETDYTATGSPPIDGVGNIATFSVSSGAASVAMSEQTDAATFHTTFALTPGDVLIAANMTTSDGASCSATKQITVVSLKPVNVRHTAFIPCEAVEGPFANQFFGGDNRVFNYAAPSYRAAFNAETTPTDNAGSTGVIEIPSTTLPPFGMSSEYDQTGAQLVAGKCNVALLPGATPIQTGMLARTSDNHKIEWSLDGPLSDHTLVVRFRLAASNPLLPAIIPTPVIGVDLWMRLQWIVNPDDGSQVVHYSVWSSPQGGHTQYPAHELYIAHRAIIQYDPIPLCGNPGWLFLDGIVYEPGSLENDLPLP